LVTTNQKQVEHLKILRDELNKMLGKRDRKELVKNLENRTGVRQQQYDSFFDYLQKVVLVQPEYEST